MPAALKSRYDKLVTEREHYLIRARAAAKLTVPSLIPQEGHTSSTEFETPWQSIGSRGVNNLASKILLALFPPGSPFFRLQMNEQAQAQAGAKKGEVEVALAAYERTVMENIEGSKTRSTLHQSGKHLICGGNVLLYDNPKTGNIRMYPLSRYVARRDASGEVYEVVATDVTVFDGLPKAAQDAVATATGVAHKSDEEMTIYTGIYRDNDEKQWKVWQEVANVEVPGSRGTYPLDASPWLPLRFTAVDGEHYGRGYVEELYGDLNTLDALTQAVTESAAAGSVVKFLVNPNGVTDIDDVVDTPNGGFAEGSVDDVGCLQVGKYADLKVALEAVREITDRLSFAFLLHSSVQRQAERVTAEEIRFMASELEDALGGTYSVLSQELQLPLVKHRISNMTKKGTLPALPDGIETEIITGLEALGRGHELQRLRMFVADASQTFGPEVVAEYVEVAEHLRRSAAALNLNTEGYVRDEQTVQENRQARAEQEAKLQAAQAQASRPPQQPQGAR